MKDITATIDRYRETVRHLWNAALWSDSDLPKDWDLSEEFEEIAASLFDVLVLWRIGLRNVTSRAVDVGPVEPLPFLRIELTTDSRVMVNRGDRTGYWDDPLTTAGRGELDLRFIGLFNWSPLDFRDYDLYRARIVGSRKYPHLVGRDVLLPIGTAVRVLLSDSDPHVDDDR